MGQGETLQSDEAKRMLKAFPKTITGKRDAAMFALMWRCGLRVQETADLDLEDIRLQARTVRVRKPKGHAGGIMPRELGLDQGTLKVLKAWLNARGAKAGPLFWTRSGSRVDQKNTRARFALVARSAQIPRHVHPHMLRHTFARSLDEEGVTTNRIQRLLGHKSLDTTAVYLAYLGPGDLGQVIQEREF